MNNAKCPVCGCQQFYVKNLEDEFDIYVFTCKNGDVYFDTESNESDTPPPVGDETETYCNTCAWHDRFKTIKIDFK